MPILDPPAAITSLASLSRHVSKRPKPKRRRKRARKSAATVVRKVKQTAQARKIRRNKRNAEQLRLAAKEQGCQHPRSRQRGVCQRPAIVRQEGETVIANVYPIPPDYKPVLRHANQPDLPNPARLCTYHLAIVTALAVAAETNDHSNLPLSVGGEGCPPDFAHRFQCPTCQALDANPERDWVIKAWLKYSLTSQQAAMELGVSTHSFNKHAQYYDLDRKKLDKAGRESVLGAIIDAGRAAIVPGMVTPKDTISAVREVGRLRGDVVENVDQRVSFVDLTSLSNAELQKRNAELAAKLAEMEGESSE